MQEQALSGLVDAPLVDSSTEKGVYLHRVRGNDGSGNNYVNQYAAGSSLTSRCSGNGYGTYESFGNSGTNSTSATMYAGTFDNNYYTGLGTTGNLYACVNGVLFQIPLSTFTAGDNKTVNSFNTPVSAASSSAVCSPVKRVLTVVPATTGFLSAWQPAEAPPPMESPAPALACTTTTFRAPARREVQLRQ